MYRRRSQACPCISHDSTLPQVPLQNGREFIGTGKHWTWTFLADWDFSDTGGGVCVKDRGLGAIKPRLWLWTSRYGHGSRYGSYPYCVGLAILNVSLMPIRNLLFLNSWDHLTGSSSRSRSYARFVNILLRLNNHLVLESRTIYIGGWGDRANYASVTPIKKKGIEIGGNNGKSNWRRALERTNNSQLLTSNIQDDPRCWSDLDSGDEKMRLMYGVSTFG